MASLSRPDIDKWRDALWVYISGNAVRSGYDIGLTVHIYYNPVDITYTLRVGYSIDRVNKTEFDIETDKLETIGAEVQARMMLLGHWREI